jgi:hypothetical protein
VSLIPAAPYAPPVLCPAFADRRRTGDVCRHIHITTVHRPLLLATLYVIRARADCCGHHFRPCPLRRFGAVRRWKAPCVVRTGRTLCALVPRPNEHTLDVLPKPLPLAFVSTRVLAGWPTYKRSAPCSQPRCGLVSLSHDVLTLCPARPLIHAETCCPRGQHHRVLPRRLARRGGRRTAT